MEEVRLETGLKLREKILRIVLQLLRGGKKGELGRELEWDELWLELLGEGEADGGKEGSRGRELGTRELGRTLGRGGESEGRRIVFVLFCFL